MIKILFTLTSFLLLNFSFGQVLTSKLLVMYTVEEVQLLEEERPQFFEFLLNYANNGVILQEVSDPKYDSGFESISAIPLRSKSNETTTSEVFIADYFSGNFNALKYGFFSKQEEQYFKIAGTNYLIIIQATTKLVKL